MRAPPLACAVRACGHPLVRQGRTYVCARRHSYDVARSGYVNLLQPQDRKSAVPGDARAAVEARALLEQAGIGQSLVEAVVSRVDGMGLPAEAVVADLGCGTGHALSAVCAGRDLVGVGIDLSVAAVTYAARHQPGPTWVVANADRTLPFLDHSVDVVVSLHGRRNAAEVARVLTPGGVLLIAVPAADDLVQLRARFQGTGAPRDRAGTLVTEHEVLFALEERFRVADERHLDRETLLSLLRATYRGARRRAAPQVEALAALDVTLASDVCVFRPRQIKR